MSRKIAFFQRINVRVLLVLLILFGGMAIVTGIINQNNMRSTYEESYSQRILLTNSLIASLIDSEEVSFFTDLLKNFDDNYKQKQVQFYHDRMELLRLQEINAPPQQQQEVFDRLRAFHKEMEPFKTERYWQVIEELYELQQSSYSTYVYVIADTGLVTEDGKMMYTFIFDASDSRVFDDPIADGLGTAVVADTSDLEWIDYVYTYKTQMDDVDYYNGEYGELCFAYAPILDDDGNVVAVLGTDLDMKEIDNAILSSSIVLNIAYIVLFIITLLIIFALLTYYIIKPISDLTKTAKDFSNENVQTVLPESVLKQRSEIGILAATIKDAMDARLRIEEELTAARDTAEQSSHYKSAFLANMSHEIRTPMNAILGMAEIRLQDPNVSAQTEETLVKICQSGDLLLNIINDILDLSKIDAGKLEISPVRYNFPSLISDSTQTTLLLYDGKPIEMVIDVDENTPYELFGDVLRIKQILNNVLSNAFKYTDEGVVKLSVWTEHAIGEITSPEPDDVIIVFEVSDTGQGMTQEQIDTIFDEFTRFNIDANRTTAGTGLGMSITKRLLDLMGGEISIMSEPDKRSIVTIYIPQKQIGTELCGADISERLNKFRYRSTEVRSKGRMLRENMPYGSVLVVDDVNSNLYVTKGMLMPYHINVDTATNGLAVIDRVKAGAEYDVIFMDHMMPKMDGIEATRILRSMGYKKPIVALTANALVGQAEMFMQNGFDGYISKPIDTRELDAVLINFIRNRKPPDIVKQARMDRWDRGYDKTVTAAIKAMVSEVEEYFVMDAESAVSTLEEISMKMPELDDESYNTYEVTVHGMKSALLNIGEKSLSDIAYRLEQASQERNIDIIAKETPWFIDALNSLIMKYKSISKGSILKDTEERR